MNTPCRLEGEVGCTECERVVFPCGLDILMFPSCNLEFFEVRHIHYPVNPSSDHFHTDAVLPSSDHRRTETVLPSSDHYRIETVSPSSDHYCINIVVSPSDHCYTETVQCLSSDHYCAKKVAPPSDHLHRKIP